MFDCVILWMSVCICVWQYIWTHSVIRCQIIYLIMCVVGCMSRYPSICFFLIWNYLFPNVSVSSPICQINSSDKHMIGQIFKQMVWQIFLSILLMICWTECPILYWMCQTKRLNIFSLCIIIYVLLCVSFMLH